MLDLLRLLLEEASFNLLMNVSVYKSVCLMKFMTSNYRVIISN
jgi:hypothetical protein